MMARLVSPSFHEKIGSVVDPVGGAAGRPAANRRSALLAYTCIVLMCLLLKQNGPLPLARDDGPA